MYINCQTQFYEIIVICGTLFWSKMTQSKMQYFFWDTMAIMAVVSESENVSEG